MKNHLFKQIDNSPLILFRMFFGALLAAECFGAIGTGWVWSVFIEPKFTFSHIGMDWLQPLPGNGMYCYFVVMGLLGLLIMLGYKYRACMAAFTVLWAGVYFMQKTSYNNHYYLFMLVSLIMCFLPAHRYASVDARLNPSIKKTAMPAWCSWVMIAQISIVYFYATVAKFYPGWMQGIFTRTLLEQSISHPVLYKVMTQKWFYLFIAYAGIAFDGLFVPLMLYKRTRTFAFIASLIFHIFNSIVLQIGIFPFFALSFAVFLFPPERIRRLFFKNKPRVLTHPVTTEGKPVFYYFFIPYLIVQSLLPLRHYLIKGDVLWTEEGHRLSWRMMLRNRNGFTNFRVVDKKNRHEEFYSVDAEVTHHQKQNMDTHPDMIWQMAQHIKKQYAKKGKDVAVYVNSRVSVNSGPFLLFIDPNVDLAAARWDYFFHCPWILLYDTKGNRIN